MAHLAEAKPITATLLNGGRIIHTEWDSFARTDLVDPGQGRPYELYIDGAAGSVMPPAGDLTLLRTDIGFFPFATARPKQVLVVGPGGGLDVWFALNGKAETITAVEINPASVDIVNRFAPYHGDLYQQPQVRVTVDEGRSGLRRAGQSYDLIYLSQVVTLAAERNGYALTENTIYTVEAFEDYLSHLRPGGQIALKLYDELTLTRALVTAAAALSQARGLTEAEAMAHLAVFLDPDAEPPIPLLLIQDQPFTPDDAAAYAAVAGRVDFVPLFVPGVTGGPTLAGLLAGESSLASIVTASPSDISPTTDDRPFFYQFERGLPASLRPLLIGLALVLLLGLVGLIIAQRPVDERPVRYAPVYFASLGVGFIMIEIALIQQTRLFLGHPTLAVTTILGVLLVGGGVGSGLAGRWPEAARPRRLVGVTALIAGLGLLWLVGWPWLSNNFLAAQTAARMIVAAASLLPLALLMGIPFPLGLWLVGHFPGGDRHVALGWAVNGVMTVAGSAGAVALAILTGFSAVMLVGAGAYGLAAIYAYWISRRE
jgi:predicted membrane-bound spermidine synthase